MHLVTLIHTNIRGTMLMAGFLFAFGMSCFGQSPTVINLSECGTSTTLTASGIPTGYTGLIWNNGTTGSSLTVGASGAYWWQVTGANVVNNGDFSSSNSGFTSQYVYRAIGDGLPSGGAGILQAEGVYAVNSDPRNTHTSFSSFFDHTTGTNTGKMLIVNGAPTANVVVWEQNITVTPNTDYVFSVWVASAHPTNPARLQFSIKNVPLGTTIIAPAAAGNWQYYTTTWNSGIESGSLPIALINQNIVASGNDFALDDIVFAPVYRQNINVTLNPIPVVSLIATSTTCGLYDLTKSIVAYDPATFTYFFKDSNGNTIAPANALGVLQSGVYTITAQHKTTGCTSLPKTTTVTIQPNPPKPGIASS